MFYSINQKYKFILKKNSRIEIVESSGNSGPGDVFQIKPNLCWYLLHPSYMYLLQNINKEIILALFVLYHFKSINSYNNNNSIPMYNKLNYWT